MAQTADNLIGVSLGKTTTVADFVLGTLTQADDGAEYRYIKASAAIAKYAIVKIDDDKTLAQLTTTLSGVEPTRVGAAQVAFALNEYGWVAVSGNFTVLVAANAAANVKLYTTATAGVADDAVADLIVGLKLTVANGGSQAGVAAYAVTQMYTN